MKTQNLSYYYYYSIHRYSRQVTKGWCPPPPCKEAPAGHLAVHVPSPIAKHLLGDHENERDLGPDPKEPTAWQQSLWSLANFPSFFIPVARARKTTNELTATSSELFWPPRPDNHHRFLRACWAATAAPAWQPGQGAPPVGPVPDGQQHRPLRPVRRGRGRVWAVCDGRHPLAHPSAQGSAPQGCQNEGTRVSEGVGFVPWRRGR